MAIGDRVKTNLLLTLPLVLGIVYFIVMEHWQHFLNALPYLVLLACPLMHVFMHRGHGHSHYRDDQESRR